MEFIFLFSSIRRVFPSACDIVRKEKHSPCPTLCYKAMTMLEFIGKD